MAITVLVKESLQIRELLVFGLINEGQHSLSFLNKKHRKETHS